MKHSLYLLIAVVCMAGTTFAADADKKYAVTTSKDGNPISYEEYGHGESALVFIHGWSCDSRYWRKQIPFLADSHHIITVDLAGHGQSGQNRQNYTMQAFGEDVTAVLNDAGVESAILIGHSMGGRVIAEAAALAPDKVVGLIGIDTLQNVEYPLTEDTFELMVNPLEENFMEGCKAFVSTMLMPDPANPELRQWIIDDMSSAPSNVAVSAISNMLSMYITGEFATVFDHLKQPVVCVNADKWPVDVEANRRHMTSFEMITITNADHFMQLNQSKEFNEALYEAINIIKSKHR